MGDKIICYFDRLFVWLRQSGFFFLVVVCNDFFFSRPKTHCLTVADEALE